LPPKADIRQGNRNVRFVPKADIPLNRRRLKAHLAQTPNLAPASVGVFFCQRSNKKEAAIATASSGRIVLPPNT